MSLWLSSEGLFASFQEVSLDTTVYQFTAPCQALTMMKLAHRNKVDTIAEVTSRTKKVKAEEKLRE